MHTNKLKHPFPPKTKACFSSYSHYWPFLKTNSVKVSYIWQWNVFFLGTSHDRLENFTKFSSWTELHVQLSTSTCGIGQDVGSSFGCLEVEFVFGGEVSYVIAHCLMSCGLTTKLWLCTQPTNHTWTAEYIFTSDVIQSWQHFSKYLICGAWKNMFVFNNWF